MEFFPSIDKSVYSPQQCASPAELCAACIKIRTVQKVQAAQQTSPCTVEASAYPASSEFPMWPQNMVVVKLRRKFKTRDSSCKNRKQIQKYLKTGSFADERGDRMSRQHLS